MSIRFKVIGLLCVVSVPLAAVDVVQAGQAERELFAARFDKAADLYAGLVKSDRAWAPGYYGWVRALLGAHRAKEAYAAAEAAQKAVPGGAPAETVLGMAAFRRGELADSEIHFRRALQLEPNYSGALIGLARILETISKFKTARQLYQAAYRSAPNDPECILSGPANQQDGPEHIATLEYLLAIYDPETREARNLRAHIALDKEAGHRKLRQLTSPYQHYDIKLVEFFSGSSSKIGVGLNVEVNQSKFRFLLDTRASGIVMSPKASRRAGLPADSYPRLATEVKIGELKLANVPIEAFSGVSVAGDDGLIGADVFRDFLVGIDFVHGRVSLDPFAERPGDQLGDAPDAPASGFTRSVRLGNRLTLPTSVDGSNGHLFLIDSSSTESFIDTNAVRVDIAGSTRTDRRPTLVFAGLRQDNSHLVAFDMGKVDDSMGVSLGGTLGMPILQTIKLTIDYREGSVRLEHLKP